MPHKFLSFPKLLLLLLFLSKLNNSKAQVTIPPYAGNQKASVTQYMGMVSVTITYNSPNIVSPLTGEDRRGKIWGSLVPYGFKRESWFEGNKQTIAPWRTGANENSTISFSHDVEVEGKKISAGTYGLFTAAGKEDWIIIFSKRSTSWGAYFYDSTEDALRIKVKPETSPFHQWLTFEFTDRKLDGATAVLLWENIKVPFRIAVKNVHDLYVAKMKEELEGTNKIFYWQAWNEAANYCLKNKVHLEQGLEWAEKAAYHPWVGETNFTTLKTKAGILELLGRKGEADSIIDFALRHASTVYQVHNYGRELIAKGEREKALAVFNLNAKLHPNTWPVNLGLARGYAETGAYDKALKFIKLAMKDIPNDYKKAYGFNKANLEDLYNRILKKEKLPLYMYGDEGFTQAY